MPIWGLSRCPAPRPSVATCCGPKSADAGASSPDPGSKNSKSRVLGGLPPAPETHYHAGLPAAVPAQEADMELEGNLVLERKPARRWVTVLAVIVPVVACLAGVTWFIRA